MLVQCHDDNGHIRVEKTFHAMKQKYFWPGLFRDKRVCSSCIEI